MTSSQDNAATAPAATTDQVQDLEAIQKLVSRLENAQRERNPADFMRLLSRDAVWVTALGRRLTGWHEINAFTNKVLTPALGDHYASFEIAHVAFLSDTVAAVNVIQIPIDKNGNPDGDEPEGRPLYVMTKSEGEWLITIAQNTRFQTDAIAVQNKAIETSK